MDFAATRAALPGLTRSMFGELISILPFKQGEMKVIADPDREAMVDVPARFDSVPDDERLGGGDRQGRLVRVASETATVTIDSRSLTWKPRSGDRVTRANGETFEIVRRGQDGNAIMILYLSGN